MKKLFILLLLCLCLSACVSEQKRDSLISTLEDKGYISSDWELFDSYEVSAMPVPGASSYDYNYKDSDGVFHSISIVSLRQRDIVDDEQYYKVYLSDDLERVEVENDDRGYRLVSNENTVRQVAKIYPKSFLFWHWYKVSVESVD